MAQAKGHRDGIGLSSENRRRPLSSGEVEGVSWQGTKTILLHKNSQGFGFSLRHFIVYPPESSVLKLKGEENGNADGNGCLQSHLEPMDTIFVKNVRENGPAQIAGLYTGDRLVRVNGESILGKTYSQVIALIQNSDNILELSIMPKDEDVLQLVYSKDAYLRGSRPFTGEAQNMPEPPRLCYSSSKPRLHSPVDNCQCQPGATSSPLDNHLEAVPLSSRSGPAKDPAPGQLWCCSSSAASALDFHFTNHNAAIASATLLPPYKSSLPASSQAHTDALCHQALSNWYCDQAQAAEGLSPHSRRVSQKRLARRGQGLALGPGTGSSSSAVEQHYRESLLQHHQAAVAKFPDSYWQESWGGMSGPESGSFSDSLLADYTEYEQNNDCSVETLKQASALISTHSTTESASAPSEVGQSAPPKGGQSAPPGVGKSGQHVAEPRTQVKDEELVRYKNYSLSFSHKTGHLLQQAPYFRESSNPPLSWSSSNRPYSSPAPPPLEEEGPSSFSLKQEVVLRQKSTVWRSPPQTHPPALADSPSPVSGAPGCTRRANSSLAQQAYDSLSSIPFIASIKGRRSSYLLAITTERSKSYDEGLNTYREEGRVFSKLPKRVKSFFMEGSLDSLRAQHEAHSKHHSTSELGTITFSNVRKEGWLHYKQILTEKGKKVGGGIRPWKRVFSVLRSQLLCLYKDKREAVLHGAGAGPGQDEHPPISIRGCLIDIAYSETKRKHVLRLTTQDFCEYLLQAEDRDNMLAWIKVIRENSKNDNEEIGLSRQALINKKLNDYRKHSPTGNKPDSSSKSHRMMPPFLFVKTDDSSMNRSSRIDENKALWGINLMKKTKKSTSPKAFGVRLEDCQPAVNQKFVPLIVEMCCGVVEDVGLEYTGIYRVPGNNAMVSSLQEHLNKGLDINTAEERWQDLNVISSLLKSFFRKLPEPLFTDDKYNDFIEANRIENTEDRLKTIKKLIHELPDHHYHTLKFLVDHLKRVADHSEKNKMEPRNLALVFGPTLVRTSEDNMTEMVTHMPDRYKIVETLILHHGWFFSKGQLDKEEKVPQDLSDSQPAPNINHLLCNIGRPGMPGDASGCATSDSIELKLSLGPKTDLIAKEFLSKSIVSAVTRKRKKSPNNLLPGSSLDEDLVHEPVKSSNYSRHDIRDRGTGGKEGEVQKDVLIKKVLERQNGVKSRENTKKKTSRMEALAAQRHIAYRIDADTKRERRPEGAAPNVAGPGLRRTLSLSQGRPVVPLWITPAQIPTMHHSSSFVMIKAVPLCYKKTHSARTRAQSMNLEENRHGRSNTGQ